MKPHESITLSRDCEAIQIPSGAKMILPAGTMVMITQSLGDTYTVTTDHGYMVRISGKDADAMGLERPQSAPAAPEAPRGEEDLEKLVWDQLRTCYDPEIPVNIVDLGLVYECAVTPLEGGGHRAEVKLTLTAPGCGMGGVLAADAQGKIGGIAGIREANVEIVFEPPWNPSMMSEAARLELGMM
ncbi:MAG TPA: putative Fe-S cluster assembly protein SufT [Candidatus Binatia bacterium]|nr:putative Fe-S cluster assembly protein SufT [Candidatus Binatia bacterium]